MKKYITITLGPITPVIALAESTKEVWAASYFFSYLAKQLISSFKERTFLLPYMSDEMFTTSDGVGSFPDRYIFEAEAGDFDAFIENKDVVFKELTAAIVKLLTNSKTEQAEKDVLKIDVLDYLNKTLKVYLFEKEFKDATEPKCIVKECESVLNQIELQSTFVATETKSYLSTLFKNVNGNPNKVNGEIIGFKGSILTQDAFGKATNKRIFESILEITAKELDTDDKLAKAFLVALNKKAKSKAELSTNDTQQTLEEVETELLTSTDARPYHKYIAIVNADGDSMGSTFAKVTDSNALSKALFEFCGAAKKIICAYHAKAIFIGGDDLLFFAPIKSGNKTIFDLLERLDKKLEEKLRTVPELADSTKLPTLSYGVSITYYKYPMFEALASSQYLLFEKAKKCEINGKKLKNNIAFNFQKHSGQTIEALIHKGATGSYSKFLAILKKYIKTPDEEASQFLSSVMHKLKGYEPMLGIMLSQGDSRTMLKNFFDNNFNEGVHKDYQALFDEIADLLSTTYTEYSTLVGATDNTLLTNKAIEITYTALRFIHFINSKRDE